MLVPRKSLLALALVAAGLLGESVLPAPMQAWAYFRVQPNYNRNAYWQGVRNAAFSNYVAGRTPQSYGLGYPNRFRYIPPYYPYYNTNVYYPTIDPWGGYLSGGADAIRAQGQFLIDQQQAKLAKEQVNQSKIETRRKSFDEWLYERARRPTNEDERERIRLEKIRRSRNNPPITEIWSGKALNDLMVGIRRMYSQGIQGPTVPLDPDILQHINVTSGAVGSTGGIGVLRNEGKLRWPLTLRLSPYKTERQRLDQLASQAFQQAETGSVDAGTIEDMSAAVDKLYAALKRNISSVTANDYIKAKRYLNDLDKSIKMLDDPNISNYVTRKWAAKGDTVAELTTNMIRQGLRFAPAVAGDEAAYVALHNAMVQYYTLPSPGQPYDPAAK
jgi:hypothetical protein